MCASDFEGQGDTKHEDPLDITHQAVMGLFSISDQANYGVDRHLDKGKGNAYRGEEQLGRPEGIAEVHAQAGHSHNGQSG